MDNEEIIREFIEAWSRLDPEELSSYFTEDGVYHNMPAEPVGGRENVKKMIAGFTRPWTGTRWEILNLVASGDVVIAERIDRTKARTKAGDKTVDLPCTGGAIARAAGRGVHMHTEAAPRRAERE